MNSRETRPRNQIGELPKFSFRETTQRCINRLRAIIKTNKDSDSPIGDEALEAMASLGVEMAKPMALAFTLLPHSL
ncbi:hypothetical protein D3C86_1820940 [compost metagenome]